MIAITSFPVTVTPGNWEAETRGSVITIATSGGLSPVDSRQRLRQQLRHEAMHLWLPNAVNLTGNYDWFYEGFATYEEQKLGVAMNHMRFDDLLATLARAYDVSRFSANGRSLVDASRERWSGANSQVYARGLTLAFLIDIAMLDASKGKRSVETLMREIFEKHKPPAAATNANDAVIAQMRAYPEVTPLVERYVTGAGPFDWSTLLQKAGLTSSTQDQLTRLAVVEKPTGRQKDLLDKLGYNNWRKLAAK
jgi:predicted metalloprotease with PDZ domain